MCDEIYEHYIDEMHVFLNRVVDMNWDMNLEVMDNRSLYKVMLYWDSGEIDLN